MYAKIITSRGSPQNFTIIGKSGCGNQHQVLTIIVNFPKLLNGAGCGYHNYCKVQNFNFKINFIILFYDVQQILGTKKRMLSYSNFIDQTCTSPLQILL